MEKGGRLLVMIYDFAGGSQSILTKISLFLHVYLMHYSHESFTQYTAFNLIEY